MNEQYEKAMEEIVERMKKIPPRKYGEIVEALEHGEWPEALGEPVFEWEGIGPGAKQRRAYIAHVANLWSEMSAPLELARKDQKMFGLNGTEYLIVQNHLLGKRISALESRLSEQGYDCGKQGERTHKQNGKVQAFTALLCGALLAESLALFALCVFR